MGLNKKELVDFCCRRQISAGQTFALDHLETTES